MGRTAHPVMAVQVSCSFGLVAPVLCNRGFRCGTVWGPVAPLPSATAPPRNPARGGGPANSGLGATRPNLVAQARGASHPRKACEV
ncbi:hypothetical protein C1280_11475 [Gemmata obscuriglobus]|uniref:Uncharacterized protein n=1 Tax=Gemmata obscuriglobus TaxID=114 RepID=A0A2Z3GW61_9BACT|nr:hypothetical protein C1280_11475 [Gemmata obscuriglobus]